MSDVQKDYRNLLISTEQKSQEAYDKTIVSLSGGALGLTLVFIENVVGSSEPQNTWALVGAWSLWALSILAVVASYIFSQRAMRMAIVQVDRNDLSGGLGGFSTKAVEWLNITSGALFTIGVFLIIFFCATNIGGSAVNEICVQKEDLKKGFTPPPPPPPPVAPK